MQSQQEQWRERNPDIARTYLMIHHFERMLASARAFGWSAAVSLLCRPDAINILLNAIYQHVVKTYDPPVVDKITLKIRFLLSKDGELSVDSSEIPWVGGEYCPNSLNIKDQEIPLTRDPCKIYLDPRSTTPSLFTKHKTTKRDMYDESRLRVNIKNHGPYQSEVLLQNLQGEIMEASLSTPYFYRNDQWVTPSEACGGNLGVTRRWALDNKLCVEGIVPVESLVDGEDVWVSNGVRGFIFGRLCLACNKEG